MPEIHEPKIQALRAHSISPGVELTSQTEIVEEHRVVTLQQSEAHLLATLHLIEEHQQAATKLLEEALDLQPIIPFDCLWGIQRDTSIRAWCLTHYPCDAMLDAMSLQGWPGDMLDAYQFFITDKAIKSMGLQQIRDRLKQWHQTFHNEGPAASRALRAYPWTRDYGYQEVHFGG